MLSEHVIEGGRVQVDDRGPAGPAADQVQQHVDGAESVDDGLDRGPCGAFVPKVADARCPAVVGQPQVPGKRGQAPGVRAHESQPRPVRSEGRSRDPTEGTRGTGDKNDAIVHRCEVCRSVGGVPGKGVGPHWTPPDRTASHSTSVDPPVPLGWTLRDLRTTDPTALGA